MMPIYVPVSKPQPGAAEKRSRVRLALLPSGDDSPSSRSLFLIECVVPWGFLVLKLVSHSVAYASRWLLGRTWVEDCCTAWQHDCLRQLRLILIPVRLPVIVESSI